ncbi:helix-turn-helix domain-containing protein [Microbacterium sp. ZW T5_45]|uniref:helix-turn-helix domain-containing protein n=1 Tax=Microbacterium sp. ZW T5_45 TaxID=3378080 RepID=UPI003852588D
MTAEQEYDREFGQKVASSRTAQNVSQRALSAELSKLGVSLDSAALSRLEQGKRAPKLQEAEAIATVLQVPLQDLLPGAERSPVEELGRAWGAIQKSTDDVLYKLTGLAGQLDHFATLLDVNPDAADELWGKEGDADWKQWMRWTVSTLTRYAPDRVVEATGERRADLIEVLEVVARGAIARTSSTVSASDLDDDGMPGFLFSVREVSDDGEHQTEA